ncbi:dihydrodipicolinate synthase family protein [Sphingobacterium sp. E70]|uniref:dihydrodipicolinate synthase family protein n=1 Tax=Sphingobacterium sp. E70 TaxID=2853439 RepID=UPI00211CF76C|nr:dihydrodipicolinate synthase family protein [Sphingobacterium sp. E70]
MNAGVFNYSHKLSYAKSKISGLIAAPFTPFDENGELNLELIPSYYEMLKRNRVSGAFICGSTGEGVSLTFDEKVAVMTAWAKLTKDDPAFTLMMLLGERISKNVNSWLSLPSRQESMLFLLRHRHILNLRM